MEVNAVSGFVGLCGLAGMVRDAPFGQLLTL